jgi:hypothetical protein
METFTLHVDSVETSSHNNFVGYLNIPLRDVVKVELVSASVHANVAQSSIIHVAIEELVSRMHDRASIQYNIGVAGRQSNAGPVPTTTVSNVNQISTALASIPTAESTTRTVFGSNRDFPAEASFYEPIRQIQEITVKLFGASGNLISTSGPTHLTLRFSCLKRSFGTC